MKFIAQIDVMPLKALLDPQGKAVTKSLHTVGFSGMDNVRIGKHITIEVEAANEAEAKTMVDEACRKMLINPIMEGYEFHITALHQ